MVVMPNHFHCIIENTTSFYHQTPSNYVDTDAPILSSKINSESIIKKGTTIGDSMDWFKTTNHISHIILTFLNRSFPGISYIAC
jgi:hypothetical protein